MRNIECEQRVGTCSPSSWLMSRESTVVLRVTPFCKDPRRKTLPGRVSFEVLVMSDRVRLKIGGTKSISTYASTPCCIRSDLNPVHGPFLCDTLVTLGTRKFLAQPGANWRRLERRRLNALGSGNAKVLEKVVSGTAKVLNQCFSREYWQAQNSLGRVKFWPFH